MIHVLALLSLQLTVNIEWIFFKNVGVAYFIRSFTGVHLALSIQSITNDFVVQQFNFRSKKYLLNKLYLIAILDEFLI